MVVRHTGNLQCTHQRIVYEMGGAVTSDRKEHEERRKRHRFMGSIASDSNGSRVGRLKLSKRKGGIRLRPLLF